MAAYPTVRKALEAFSVELGLEDETARDWIRRALENPTWRASLEAELGQLVDDPDAPWQDLVANDRYEIDEPESDAHARRIVIDTLWDIVFPGKQRPA